MIYEGLLAALAEGAPREAAGILVDEQFGAEVARKAKAEGLTLAMPVEKSGQNEFDFQYGDDFGDHIERLRPDVQQGAGPLQPRGRRRDERAAVGPAEAARRMAARARPEVPVRAAGAGRAAQLEAVGGDEGRYDVELRPGLMLRAIARAAGGRHRAGHLEDRGHRPPRGLRGDRRADPQRRRPRAASCAWCSGRGRRRRRRRPLAADRRAACPATSGSRSAARSGGTR